MMHLYCATVKRPRAEGLVLSPLWIEVFLHIVLKTGLCIEPISSIRI